ncbi:MAG: DUF721 domain-containing protein [Gammaproteobacteria bacterium]|nr:DUF721 domain-containing protein [Gammaproteobacteria bacterium]
MNFPQPMYKYLKRKKDGVADLVTKARFMGKLNQEFLKNIPAPINLHVQLAYINGAKLYVIADSPAWATKFRFMSAHIIPTLRKNIQYFQYVKEVSVSTRPIITNETKTKKTSSRYISSEAKSCLENMAESLDNADLKRSLMRLAKRHKQK